MSKMSESVAKYMKELFEAFEKEMNADASIHIEKKDGEIKMSMTGTCPNLLVLFEDGIARVLQEEFKDDVQVQLKLADTLHDNLKNILEEKYKV